MVPLYRHSIPILLGFIAVLCLTMSASGAGDDETHRVEWVWLGEEITSPSEPVAPPSATLPRRSFNPYEEASIELTMGIRNLGSGDDNASLEGYTTNAAVTVSVSPTLTYLEKDQTKFVRVTIGVSKDIPPGIYTLFLNASCEDPGFVTRVASLAFEVYNLDAEVPPVPTITVPGMGDVVRSEFVAGNGTNVSLKLAIRNNGTRTLPSVTVRAIDNYVEDGVPVRWNFWNLTTPPIDVDDRFIAGEAPFDATNPPLTWRADVYGGHTLEFHVFLDHQSNVLNDVAVINITVNRPPVIHDLEPAPGSVFREGDTITFHANVTDPDGDDLDYYWMEGLRVLGREPAYNSSHFQPGEHTVTLIVDDGTEASSENITFTVKKGRATGNDGPGPSAVAALVILTTVALVAGRRGRTRGTSTSSRRR